MESGDVIEEMRRVTFFGALFVLARSVAIASLAIISTDRVHFVLSHPSPSLATISFVADSRRIVDSLC